MSDCVTHHYACECREKQFRKLEFENAMLRTTMTTGDRNWTQLLAERDEYKAKAVRLTHVLDRIAKEYEDMNDGIEDDWSARAQQALETWGVKE